MADETKRELAPVSMDAGKLLPQNLTEALEVARALAHSGMVPDCYSGKPGAVLAAVQMGAELGLSPMASLRNIAVINGRPSVWGDALKAVVLSQPDLEIFDEDSPSDALKAGRGRCKIKRRGQVPVEVTFSVEDAKKAGLWTKKGPWQDYPGRMLQARARSWAIRDAYADALAGVSIREEAEDTPRGPDNAKPVVGAEVTPSEPKTKRLIEQIRGEPASNLPSDEEQERVFDELAEKTQTGGLFAKAKEEPGADG